MKFRERSVESSWSVPAEEIELFRGNGRFTGTSGDDVIRGSKRDDRIDVSQGGIDSVDGRDGNDTIYFGAAFTADDRVDGGSARSGTRDTIVLQGDYSGGIRFDSSHLWDIEGIQLLSGGSYVIGGDMYFGHSYAVPIDGSALLASETLFFDGSETKNYFQVAGGAGDDVMIGGGVDTLGELGGGAGDDALSGGAGYTGLYGDLGADMLTSGTGITHYIYGDTHESLRGHADMIFSFKGADKISLLAIDADISKNGHELFHLGATPGHVGDLIVSYNKAQDVTLVRAFTDGDAKADMEIRLDGHVPLTPDNFTI